MRDLNTERLSLSKATLYLLEECRMVLPGIQALLGFQLTVVFSEGFSKRLSLFEQRVHLLAIVLLAIAMVLIMAPAACHRQAEPEHVTERLIRAATKLMLASMVPLAFSICAELYLVAKVIAGSHWAGVSAAILAALMLGCWFVLPRWLRLTSGSRWVTDAEEGN